MSYGVKRPKCIKSRAEKNEHYTCFTKSQNLVTRRRQHIEKRSIKSRYGCMKDGRINMIFLKTMDEFLTVNAI